MRSLRLTPAHIGPARRDGRRHLKDLLLADLDHVGARERRARRVEQLALGRVLREPLHVRPARGDVELDLEEPMVVQHVRRTTLKIVLDVLYLRNIITQILRIIIMNHCMI